VAFWEELLGRIAGAIFYVKTWNNPGLILRLFACAAVGFALWKLWIDVT